MKKVAVLLLLTTCSHLLFSKLITKSKAKFGEYMLPDVLMKSYKMDSSADVRVLDDYEIKLN